MNANDERAPKPYDGPTGKEWAKHHGRRRVVLEVGQRVMTAAGSGIIMAMSMTTPELVSVDVSLDDGGWITTHPDGIKGVHHD